MNKKNLIVSSNDRDFYTTTKLMENAEKLKYSAKWINPYQITLPLAAPYFRGGLFFHRTTGTNYDDYDLLISQAFAQRGLTVTNPLPSLSNFRAKDQQYLFFLQHRVPHVPTFLYRGKTTEEIKQSLVELKNEKDERFILKLTRGNQGIGVTYVEGLKSLLSLMETFEAMKDQRFLIQPYMEHQKEWRLLVCGDKILACIEKKINRDDFRGNASRAKARPVKKVPQELEALALQVSRVAGLHYAGIDVLMDGNDRHRVLEINPVPGFQQVEELSGLNVARELILACPEQL